MANEELKVNIKQLLSSVKTTSDLGIFQIEALEAERDKYKSAFVTLLEKVNKALATDDLEVIKKDFKEIIDSLNQNKNGAQ